MNENKSINSLKKQLVAAVAMVCVAAVALGSSTYAWFVSNNSVTANGITVNATSEAGILISHHDEDKYSTTASGIFNSAHSLYPTSTNDASKWFHASAKEADKSAAADNTMKTLTIAETNGVGAADGKDYYVVDKFDIYTTGSANDLVVSNIDVNNDVIDFDKSLRLLFVCADGSTEKKFVVAPGYNGTSDDKNVKYEVGTNADGKTEAGTQTTAYTVENNGKNILSATVSQTKDTPTVVTVYAYFEGEDKNHTTEAFKAGDDLAVTITFSANVQGKTN